jgi:hypothetical protein
MPRYQSHEIIEYAVLLRRTNISAGISDQDLRALLRIKFPGITNRTITRAFDDARLLLAIKQVMKEYSGEEK